jgi:rhodanese-related sulfurtransferase
MRIIKLFILIIILSIIMSGCTNSISTEEEEGPISTNVTIEESKDLINDMEDLLILDVRTKGEFDAGHIEGSIQIPVDELEDRINELEEYRGNPILVYCRSGNRSSQAVNILLNNEFGEIYHMNEGFMNWK